MPKSAKAFRESIVRFENSIHFHERKIFKLFFKK